MSECYREKTDQVILSGGDADDDKNDDHRSSFSLSLFIISKYKLFQFLNDVYSPLGLNFSFRTQENG